MAGHNNDNDSYNYNYYYYLLLLWQAHVATAIAWLLCSRGRSMQIILHTMTTMPVPMPEQVDTTKLIT